MISLLSSTFIKISYATDALEGTLLASDTAEHVYPNAAQLTSTRFDVWLFEDQEVGVVQMLSATTSGKHSSLTRRTSCNRLFLGPGLVTAYWLPIPVMDKPGAAA